jgi:hypothetical protein
MKLYFFVLRLRQKSMLYEPLLATVILLKTIFSLIPLCNISPIKVAVL